MAKCVYPITWLAGREGEAAGPGRINEAGKRIAMDVKTGDVVLYARYTGAEIKIDERQLLILKESEILAIDG